MTIRLRDTLGHRKTSYLPFQGQARETDPVTYPPIVPKGRKSPLNREY
jgi:hypothetical protein